MVQSLSDYFKNYNFVDSLKQMGQGFVPQINTLPNGGGTYSTPVPKGTSSYTPTAPVAPVVTAPVVPSKPIFSQPAPQSVAQAPTTRSKYINPATGQDYATPEEYANAMVQRIPVSKNTGDVDAASNLSRAAGDYTSPQLESMANKLNNTRNDIATGNTDPYDITKGGTVVYSPQERQAIEKAYAGIYDPAITDVLSKLDAKQKQDAADKEFSRQVALKQMEIDAGDPTSSKNQDKYEQEYRNILIKPLSNRSGGLGLEDQKVNQAIHLATLVNQYKDANGNYNIPKTQYNELALGLARLISPNGVVGSEVQNSITQASLKGDINAMLTYATGTPFNGSTQDVYNMLVDSIDRQGTIAQQNRDQYMQYLQGLMPTNLSADRQAKLEKNLLNLYTPVKSADKMTSPDGTQEVTKSQLTPSELKELTDAGWK